ncbi:MAG: hypothetical protein M1820_009933 [Bogoriella megaspora]|nr:MAG: hypothetical protein M1820_009933 [Bogoriella megaspora]
MTGTPLAMFGTVKHDLHRLRRSAVNNFFSKKSIYDIEYFIQARTKQMCEFMQKQLDRDGVVEVRTNFLAYSTDIICGHAFHEQRNLLDDEDSARKWRETISAVALLTPIARQLPWLLPLSLKIPIGVWNLVAPPLGRVVAFQQDMHNQAITTINQIPEATLDDGTSKGTMPTISEGLEIDDSVTATKRPTVFRTILLSRLPPNEKSSQRLAQEGYGLVAAGGETCSRTLTSAVYYVLANKERVIPRLQEELKTVMPTADASVGLKTLENLPWLTAVIRETLRLMALLIARVPLVSPDKALTYGDYTIPPGFPVSMSLADVLHDPKIFPEPLKFRPERWLPENPHLERINRFYVPYGKGPRACIGLK